VRNAVPVAGTDHDACGVGFVARLGGAASSEVVERALTALGRLSHRGGVDADGSSGDGAGLLTPIPEGFFRDRAQQANVKLPETFGLGMAFLAPGQELAACSAIESLAARSGLQCLGWREVPMDSSILGSRAAATLPVIRQCFFAAENPASDLEGLLYLLRKRVEAKACPGAYFCSLSSRTVVYKGLLAPSQVRDFYPDLASPDFKTTFAIFHQRYSTNTRPTWALAQPFRFVAHNGEINTISANRRWMRAREQKLRSELHVGNWFNALEERVSDSASFDNALEVLLHRGYSAAAAMLRMVPLAWETDRRLSPELRAYLQTEAGEQEPWDGPAALVFSDGRLVGAKLDRNGLRPLRVTLTSDRWLTVGSEAGIADLRGKQVAERQRLGPGEMLLVDPAEGRIVRDSDLTEFLPARDERPTFVQPLRVEAAPAPTAKPTRDPKRVASALGWSEDQYRLLFQCLGVEGKEATWSMGDDAPPAFLSAARRALWDYCKQRFAQVTNPAIDPLREAHVMSLDVHLGERVVIGSPVVDAGHMQSLRSSLLAPAQSVDFTFEAASGVEGALAALEHLREEVGRCAQARPGIVVLSDRSVSARRAALPALLALAAAWKELVRAGAFDVPVIVETGQVVETHHVALLIAAGASAVFPYLALELAEIGTVGGAARYRMAVEVGLRKVLARMGISTMASYRNSQLFETVGLDEEVCASFFEDATAVLGGKTLAALLQDSLERHANAFAPGAAQLRDEGLYRFRQTGERHSNSPELVRRMHQYVKAPTAENYRAFAELAETREPVAVRDLFEIMRGAPISVDEVEPQSSILSRLSTQAMSLGALGVEAHRTLAIAMNRLGARSNTGEGGEDPDVYHFEPEAANRVKQVASARFGVTAEYLVRAHELEIKMAQGSKPGEGGQLPASKVTPYIARLRHAVPGMSLISPPPHHDIYSIEDLAQLIYDLRAVNPEARIGVKLVAGAGVGIIAAGVAKAGADVITICGFDGGTGASPLTSIKNTGLPWEVGLREAHNTLLQTGFRRRVRLRVDGGFKSGRDVIVAALLGADEFGFGTSALLSIGCIMARQCHLNTCPAGIATQDEKMRTRFTGNPEMLMAYFHGVAQEVRERLAMLGARSLGEVVGCADRLQPRNADAARALGCLLEPSPQSLVEFPDPSKDTCSLHTELARVVGRLKSSRSRRVSFSIANSDRSVGAHLSGWMLRRTSYAGFEEEPIECEFRGSAGQSFGAFLISGLRFRLRGEANDYVGKGLSGGTISIDAGMQASLRGDVLAGNTVLYGATSGELYIAGRAGERFAVRNSGALAVVEGVGQHCSEYMTAGVVVILGPAGINLGSGMTGGLVYILRDSLSGDGYNQEFVRPVNIDEPIEEEEETWLRLVLSQHARFTGSPRAKRLLKGRTPLPLVRLEPVVTPCSCLQTWSPILARLEKQFIAAAAIPEAIRSKSLQSAGEPVI
jgi:glutamate synthase (ferredoxin)